MRIDRRRRAGTLVLRDGLADPRRPEHGVRDREAEDVSRRSVEVIDQGQPRSAGGRRRRGRRGSVRRGAVGRGRHGRRCRRRGVGRGRRGRGRRGGVRLGDQLRELRPEPAESEARRRSGDRAPGRRLGNAVSQRLVVERVARDLLGARRGPAVEGEEPGRARGAPREQTHTEGRPGERSGHGTTDDGGTYRLHLDRLALPELDRAVRTDVDQGADAGADEDIEHLVSLSRPSSRSLEAMTRAACAKTLPARQLPGTT